MDYFEESGGKLKKAGIVSICIALAIITMINSCSIVQQRERGVKYVLGKVVGNVIQPGVTLHAPFVAKIKKYSIAPKTYDVAFLVDNGGAITKDMQTVGTSVTVKYAYDESRIMDIATRYGDSVVESAMKSNIIASVKEVVGQYSIYELVEKQAEQEANIAAANAQKLVREAEAKKQAMQLDAEAQLIKAENEAKAKKAEADGIAYYNAKVAQNMSVQQQQWKHEEQMAYYEKWNGTLVPQYVPLTAPGGIVNIPPPSQTAR